MNDIDNVKEKTIKSLVEASHEHELLLSNDILTILEDDCFLDEDHLKGFEEYVSFKFFTYFKGISRYQYVLGQKYARLIVSEVSKRTYQVKIRLSSHFENSVSNILKSINLNAIEAINFVRSFIDQLACRRIMNELGILGFIKNGSILPLQGLDTDKLITFQSPKSLEVTLSLPYSGNITGLAIRRGITLVLGAGFHGKSTFLKALSNGIYFKTPGDRQEFVVCDQSAVTIRSEEGRSVRGVDVRAFITNIPVVADISPNFFSTHCASGSTSIASSVMESIECKSKLFLLDEDNCASNFMIQCSRMRALLKDSTIIPFIYRVNSLYHELGISSVIVVGGSGDWFDVHDIAIMMDNYRCLDVTDKTKSISKSFCNGRVTYNGTGLVHQLRWPSFVDFNKLRSFRLSSIEKYVNCAKIRNDENSLQMHNDRVINLSCIEQRLKTSSYVLGVGVSIALIFLRLRQSAKTFVNCVDILETYECILHSGLLSEEWNFVYSLTESELFEWPRTFEVIAVINRMHQLEVVP